MSSGHSDSYAAAQEIAWGGDRARQNDDDGRHLKTNNR